jgi:hypothetical protein
MPRCMAQYEAGHRVCDGDDTSNVLSERAPCAYRNACVALMCRMAETGRGRSAYVVERTDIHGVVYAAPASPEALGRIVRKAVLRYGVTEGRATTPPAPRPITMNRMAAPGTVVSRRGNKKGKPPPPRSATALALDPWYDEWMANLVAATGRDLARLPVEARMGELYARDCRVLSYYVAVYCRGNRRVRDVPVACLVWRPRYRAMDVKFSVSPGSWVGIGRDTMRMLKPVPHKDGVWISIAELCDRGRVRLAGQVVARLIGGGILKLPEAS